MILLSDQHKAFDCSRQLHEESYSNGLDNAKMILII